jgi:hypothetical protein
MTAYLNARRKPIVGVITSAVTYLATAVGLDLDPELAALISGAVFAFFVERTRNV